MIAIVDYDMGNVASVANMLKRVGTDAVLTRDPEILARAEKIILPGVGAFDKGMRKLRQFDLIAFDCRRRKKVPSAPFISLRLRVSSTDPEGRVLQIR